MILEMPIHEYKCSKGHVTEEYFISHSSVMDKINCWCGFAALRILSMVHFDFPNLPKFMDERHKRDTELRRQQLGEKMYKEDRDHG